MKNLKDFILGLNIVFWIRIILQQLSEAIAICRAFGNKRTKDKDALKTDLFILAHALEKGMSIGHGRSGFGKAKAISIIKRLPYLMSDELDKDFVDYIVSILNSYIEYNCANGADMQEVKLYLSQIVQLIPMSKDTGIYHLYHQNIQRGAQSDFRELSQSRFSVRDFGDYIVEETKIQEALKLCQRTPSACNRQSWRVHVYKDKTLIDKICGIQGGSKGFAEKFQYAILICSDLHWYAFPEFNVPFVDGGLYAMNLMYALNYYDVASIPLTMGMKQSVINKIHKELNIPFYEVPVILIGAGSYKDQFKTACSHRKDYHRYTTFQ